MKESASRSFALGSVASARYVPRVVTSFPDRRIAAWRFELRPPVLNQSPLPTPAVVTPAAAAPVAPPSGAAGL